MGARVAAVARDGTQGRQVRRTSAKVDLCACFVQDSAQCPGSDRPLHPPLSAFAIDRVCTFVSLRPDTMVFNAAISACEKGRAWATALRLMQQMRGMGCQPTAVTYGASISACEKGLQWQKVRIGGRESSLARIPLCDPASHPHTHLCLHLRHFCRHFAT